MQGDHPPDPKSAASPGTKASRGQSFTDILAIIAHDPASERVSFGDLLAAMGDRAFGALMVVFALPNVVPTPPGASAILAAPLVLLATQLMLGKKPWLPAILAQRSMLRIDFAALIERAAPWLGRAERLLRPRLEFLVHPPAEYAIGALCLLLAIVLVLPIPFGNILPTLAICILSFSILGQDGLWAIAGVVVSVFALALVAAVVYSLAKAALFIVTNAFT